MDDVVSDGRIFKEAVRPTSAVVGTNSVQSQYNFYHKNRPCPGSTVTFSSA